MNSDSKYYSEYAQGVDYTMTYSGLCFAHNELFAIMLQIDSGEDLLRTNLLFIQITAYGLAWAEN